MVVRMPKNKDDVREACGAGDQRDELPIVAGSSPAQQIDARATSNAPAAARIRGDVITAILNNLRAQIESIEASYTPVFSIKTPSSVMDNFRFTCRVMTELENLRGGNTLDITMGIDEVYYSPEEDENWYPTCGYVSEFERAEMSYKNMIGNLEEHLLALKDVGIEVVTGFISADPPEMDGPDEEVEVRWSPSPSF